jgi:hypothetical protein
VKGALSSIYAQKHEEKVSGWTLASTVFDDWLDTLQRRIRNVCRVVSQGEIKTPSADWVQRLPWNKKETDEQNEVPAKRRRSAKSSEVKAEQEEDEDEEGASDEYEYGFLLEVLLPYRCKKGSDYKEPGLAVKLVAGATDDDFIMGRWPDGSEHEIKDCTHGKFKDMSSNKRVQDGCLFMMEKADNKHKLTISQKIDRSLLMVLYEQGKFMLNFKLQIFGPIEDQNKRLASDDPVCKAGLEFMKPIVMDYAAGKIIGKDGLKEAKDAKLEAMGLSSRPKLEPKKKPAASTASDTGGASPSSTVPPAKKPAACREKPAKEQAATKKKKKKTGKVKSEITGDVNREVEEKTEEDHEKLEPMQGPTLGVMNAMDRFFEM